MKMMFMLCLAWLSTALSAPALAQTTEFTYQGHLTDSGTPQATYQMRFRLFAVAASGSQIGSTVENLAVPVSDGVFKVPLDFGAAVFTGADRYLEIAVRRNAQQVYTVLSPRQKIASSPYAVRTLSAQSADMALDAQKLGGVAAADYVTTATVGSAVIRNGTALQDADFNIDGKGYIGTGLGIGVGSIQAGYGLDMLGNLWLSNPGSAHSVVRTTGGTNSWARYYMRTANRSWFLGTSQAFNGDQFYLVDETAAATRLAISSIGHVGINNTAPQSGLDIRGTGFQVQQRITDNTSGNSLVLQGGATGNTKITGYNYGTSTGVPLYIGPDGANTVMNSGGGHVLQPGGGFGLPKAMVYVLGTGVIDRCYNGITGATTNGCGFSVSVSDLHYTVNFGFDVSKRFYSASSYDVSSTLSSIWEQVVQRIFRPLNVNSLTVVHWLTWRTFEQSAIVASDFFLIIY